MGFLYYGQHNSLKVVSDETVITEVMHVPEHYFEQFPYHEKVMLFVIVELVKRIDQIRTRVKATGQVADNKIEDIFVHHLALVS